jgi:hypothetical protein
MRKLPIEQESNVPKLNQVLSIEKNVKARAISEIDKIDKAFQKPALFDGFAKLYQKLDEKDEDVPPQRQNVQIKARLALKDVSMLLAKMLDVGAQLDFANCNAKADIVIGTEKIVEGVPATYLMFLEKQLTDLHTLVDRAPTLDPAEEWKYAAEQGFYKTEPTQTSRTKKVQKALVLLAPTDKHPGQAQVITDDVTVGTYQLTKFSGAIPEGDKRAIIEKIDKMSAAVKFARQQANSVDAPEQDAGTRIMDWLFQS